jgi:hypothetical protein
LSEENLRCERSTVQRGKWNAKENPRWIISKHLGFSGSVFLGFSDVDGHHRHRHHRHGERHRLHHRSAERSAPNNCAVRWVANNCGARSCAATECRSEARRNSCGCRHCKRAAYSCGYHCLKACTRGSRCSWLAAGWRNCAASCPGLCPWRRCVPTVDDWHHSCGSIERCSTDDCWRRSPEARGQNQWCCPAHSKYEAWCPGERLVATSPKADDWRRVVPAESR